MNPKTILTASLLSLMFLVIACDSEKNTNTNEITQSMIEKEYTREASVNHKIFTLRGLAHYQTDAIEKALSTKYKKIQVTYSKQAMAHVLHFSEKTTVAAIQKALRNFNYNSNVDPVFLFNGYNYVVRTMRIEMKTDITSLTNKEIDQFLATIKASAIYDIEAGEDGSSSFYVEAEHGVQAHEVAARARLVENVTDVIIPLHSTGYGSQD